MDQDLVLELSGFVATVVAGRVLGVCLNKNCNYCLVLKA